MTANYIGMCVCTCRRVFMCMCVTYNILVEWRTHHSFLQTTHCCSYGYITKTNHMSICVYVCLSVCLFLSLSISVVLCLCFSVSLFLYFSLFLSFFVSVSLSLSVSVSICFCLSVSISLSHTPHHLCSSTYMHSPGTLQNPLSRLHSGAQIAVGDQKMIQHLLTNGLLLLNKPYRCD